MGSVVGGGKKFVYFTLVPLGLILHGYGAISPEVKQSGREADHSKSRRSKLKRLELHPCVFMPCIGAGTLLPTEFSSNCALQTALCYTLHICNTLYLLQSHSCNGYSR